MSGDPQTASGVSTPGQSLGTEPVVISTTPPGDAGRTEKGKSWLLWPSVVPLLLWMIVPLAMTIYFSFIHYSIFQQVSPWPPDFAGFDNYLFLIGDPSFVTAIINTLLFIGVVLIISVVAGVLLAILYDLDFFGHNVAMLFVIAPFFVMPPVSVLVWKNLLMDPVNGLFSVWTHNFNAVLGFLHLDALQIAPIDWFADYPLMSVIIIVAWEWIPFAFLILITSLKSLDLEQREAASIDGAGPLAQFFYIVLPHLMRAITVVVMIETIFLLGIFAEIYASTKGGPGDATTTLTYLVYLLGLSQGNYGVASAGGILAVILANIVSFFLVRTLAKNLGSTR
jgi:sorbitol/mannitol transport system permease protein